MSNLASESLLAHTCRRKRFPSSRITHRDTKLLRIFSATSWSSPPLSTADLIRSENPGSACSPFLSSRALRSLSLLANGDRSSSGLYGERFVTAPLRTLCNGISYALFCLKKKISTYCSHWVVL